MKNKIILLEQMDVYNEAVKLCDEIWEIVKAWNYFEKKTIGDQLVRALDSIGANIAEGYGRFHYGEKIKFYYYARGSLFESQFWIKRTRVRKLVSEKQVRVYLEILKEINKQLNYLIKSCKDRKNK